MIPLLRQTALRCPTIPVMISADAPDDSAVRTAFTGPMRNRWFPQFDMAPSERLLVLAEHPI